MSTRGFPKGEVPLGASRRFEFTFRGLNGAVADPTTITVYTETPDGTETEYVYDDDVEVVRSSTGIYYMDVVFDEVGAWLIRVRSTGAVYSATPDMPWTVTATSIALSA
jgi:hypothetical protein